jgi:long-subunit acyl-CoA synthetase (AMP-forming)
VFKLSQGEYVSSETIESAYQKCGISGQVWVYGNSFKSFLIGVIVPAPEPTAAYLQSKGWWPKSDKESTKLAADSFEADYKATMNGAHKEEIRTWVLEQLRAQEKPLKGFERVKDWIIETKYFILHRMCLAAVHRTVADHPVCALCVRVLSVASTAWAWCSRRRTTR